MTHNRPVVTVLLWVAAVVLALAYSAGAAAQDPRRTVWDGVYTEEQAKRGQEAYRQVCGHCHRDDLSGGGSEVGAPALVGPLLIFRWRDQSLVDLFITIGTTMPQNKPDSLTPATVIDIVSFLLKANDMPAGDVELPPDLEKLKQIFVTERASR